MSGDKEAVDEVAGIGLLGQRKGKWELMLA